MTIENTLLVYGIQEKPRHGVTSEQVLYVNLSNRCKSYTERDDFMLSQAGQVFCIWDCESNGTKRVYDKAIGMGKTAWIKEVV